MVSKETAAHDKDDKRVPEHVKQPILTAKQRLKLQLHREQQQKENNKCSTQPRSSLNTSEENEPTISPMVSNVS
jgi:hypothetical protein